MQSVDGKRKITTTCFVCLLILAVVGVAPRSSEFVQRLDSPDIFTAVQKQLGLKLDARKGPVDVLVIDHAEETDAN